MPKSIRPTSPLTLLFITESAKALLPKSANAMTLAVEWMNDAAKQYAGLRPSEAIAQDILSNLDGRDYDVDDSHLFAQTFALLVVHLVTANGETEQDLLSAGYWMEFWCGRWGLTRQAKFAESKDKEAYSYASRLKMLRESQIKGGKNAARARAASADDAREAYINEYKKLRALKSLERHNLISIVTKRLAPVHGKSRRTVARYIDEAGVGGKGKKKK